MSVVPIRYWLARAKHETLPSGLDTLAILGTQDDCWSFPVWFPVDTIQTPAARITNVIHVFRLSYLDALDKYHREHYIVSPWEYAKVDTLGSALYDRLQALLDDVDNKSFYVIRDSVLVDADSLARLASKAPAKMSYRPGSTTLLPGLSEVEPERLGYRLHTRYADDDATRKKLGFGLQVNGGR